MDTCLVHPPVFVFPNDTGERWIDFLVLDAMFNALSLKQGQELPPHEITLHSLPLAIVTRQSFAEFMASDLLSAIVRYPPSAVAFIDGCDYNQRLPGTQIAAQMGRFFKLETIGA